jgi:hypothetical protein
MEGFFSFTMSSCPPLPRLKSEMEGFFLLLYRHAHPRTSPPLPRSKHEMEGFLSFAISTCQPPHISDITTPPSLKTRDGGVFSFTVSHPHTHHHCPLPRLKRETEGAFYFIFLSIFYYTITTPPSFKIRDGGACFLLIYFISYYLFIWICT